jgi:hypothetical protein
MVTPRTAPFSINDMSRSQRELPAHPERYNVHPSFICRVPLIRCKLSDAQAMLGGIAIPLYYASSSLID